METETELLNAARMMNQEALVKIFDLYAQPLYRYALRLCRDPTLADQIVGDVFAKLLDQFSSGHGPTATLRSYLYEAVYHRVVDEARSSKRKAPLELVDWFPPAVQDGRTSLEDRVLLEQILHTIQNILTEDQRHVIILRFLESFSLHETAALIGKKEDHVRVIQSRAMMKLRKALAHQESGTVVPLSTNGEQSKTLRI